MQIIIVGAGLGGLTLAQALIRAGHDVAVLDRDADVDATSGYRITLDDQACAALRRHLTSDTYQALLASAGSRASFSRFCLTDTNLSVLFAEEVPRDEELVMIGRRPLRRLLSRDILGHIRFGVTVVSTQVTDDGRALVLTAAGKTLSADLVVLADGAGSRLAAEMAGRPTASSTGVVGTAMRVPLAPHADHLLPDLLRTSHVMAVTTEGVGCFMGVHDPTRPPVDPRLCRVPPEPEPRGLTVGIWAREGTWPSDVLRAGSDPLHRELVAATRHWHPALKGLIRSADPGTVAGFRFLAADPTADLTPWPAGPITALGDAIHAMPPTGGQAGATAIRDADHLATRIAEISAGRVGLGTGIADYHRDVAGYAPQAVRESLEPLTWLRRLATPGVAPVLRPALPVVAAWRHAFLRRTAR